MSNSEPAASRRAQARPGARAPRGPRRIVYFLVGFLACVLALDALIGERGLLATMRARRQYAELEGSIAQLRRENARLREDARRLREDPDAIEALARKDLGLIRPGEVLFIIKDVAAPGTK